MRAEIFDEEEALHAEGRPVPGSQSIQIYDVVLLAHHFNVSLMSALYRLKNLKYVNQPEFDTLREQEEAGAGRAIASLLDLKEVDEEDTRHEFMRRFLALGFEAFRRETISRAKLIELAAMVGVSRDVLEEALEDAGLEPVHGAEAHVPED